MFSDGSVVCGSAEPGADLPAKDGGHAGAPVLPHLPGGRASLLQRLNIIHTRIRIILLDPDPNDFSRFCGGNIYEFEFVK